MKKNIAIVAGGDSSEWQVSLRSAEGLMNFIPSEKYNKYIVTIIGKEWNALVDGEKTPIDKNDFSFTYKGEKTVFDCAYITIHGTPGENGILQGYFRLMRIPFTCCDVLPASLTFDKFFCNSFLRNSNVKIAKSIELKNRQQQVDINHICNYIGLPCFIKPSAGGSSFGVTKVKTKEQIIPAITKAFDEGSKVMIESFISGNELTCGMYKTAEKTVVFPVTEVVTHNEFFDYDAKYNGQVDEITPARIPDELARKVQEMTAEIYDLIEANGIIRVDYIVTEEGEIYMLEINTTPGMTATSFIPQQIRAAQLNISDVMTEIIENSINKQF